MGETSGKVWDDGRAWEVSRRAEAYMREHQPKGWQATPEEDQRFDTLLARRRLASATYDMELWERTHAEMLELLISSWKRYREQRTPKPKSKPAKKKTGKLKA